MIVWLASYPRSGNTLLRMLIRHGLGQHTYSRYNDVNDIGRDEALAEAIGHVSYPEGQWATFAAAAAADARPVFVKTHHLPSDDAPAIYVVRDGRAATVSYRHYLSTYGQYGALKLSEVIVGAAAFGSWGDHVRSWHPGARPNTLLLRYEDMAADPGAAIARIAAFLRMRQTGSQVAPFAELNARFPHFFRAGGNDRNIAEFSPADAALFAATHGQVMAELGYPLEPPFEPTMDMVEVALGELSLALGQQVAARERVLSHARRQLEEARQRIAHLNRRGQGGSSTAPEDERHIEALQATIARQSEEIERLRHPLRRAGALIPGVRATVRATRRALAFKDRVVNGVERRVVAALPPGRRFRSLVPAQWRELPPQAEVTDRAFGIAVFTFNREALVESVLTSLGQQGALGRVHVFMDGDQGKPELKTRLDHVAQTVGRFPIRGLHRNRGNLGFRKVMLHAMAYMAERYDRILFLEDDCFPTRDCVATMGADLDAVADRPDVFSVYGHPFLVPGEGCFGRFQGWGWATTAPKLAAMREELWYWYSRPEEEFLAFAKAAMTKDLLARIDVTPGRQPSYTLRHFFAWDEALCLLSALRGMNHVRTSKRVVYNCGASPDAAHFGNVDHFRAPPFNMVSPDEIWSHF